MKTELYDQHQQLNGKIVEFAGYQMPLNYGSQLQEHIAVREQAGMFDVSHMGIVDIKGADAEKFLRYLLANDVAKLKNDGAALYTCLLNENGCVLDDLLAYKMKDNDYRLVINAATKEKDTAWINKQQASFNVDIIVHNDLSIIAVQGPQAIQIVSELFADTKNLKRFHCYLDHDICIARTGYTGEDGVEMIVPNKKAALIWQNLLNKNVTPCGLGARDSLRLEAGLNLYGHDMDETTTPLESNLSWTVAFSPEDRDFIGKQALLEQKQQGLKRKLVGLVLEKGGILREAQKVLIPNNGEGIITSGGFAPSLGHAIALARVPIETKENAIVLVRNKELPVSVVRPPFYKK